MTDSTNASGALTRQQQDQLRFAIEDGLPLVVRPYQALAEQIDASEAAVTQCIQQWIDNGLIKRFGIVVRHHKLGYQANAMVVWNVKDSDVDAIGERIKETGLVTLCYQRPRRLPHWPYNLFCMIHGKDREWVEARIQQLIEKAQLQHIEHQVLFSYKQYKQCGGHFQSKKPRSEPILSQRAQQHG